MNLEDLKRELKPRIHAASLIQDALDVASGVLSCPDKLRPKFAETLTSLIKGGEELQDCPVTAIIQGFLRNMLEEVSHPKKTVCLVHGDESHEAN